MCQALGLPHRLPQPVTAHPRTPEEVSCVSTCLSFAPGGERPLPTRFLVHSRCSLVGGHKKRVPCPGEDGAGVLPELSSRAQSQRSLQVSGPAPWLGGLRSQGDGGLEGWWCGHSRASSAVCEETWFAFTASSSMVPSNSLSSLGPATSINQD